MWDERYSQPDYLFGKEPAAFLKSTASHLRAKSRILAVADGEGRNSVYLATLGHEVTAMDTSAVAQDKARKLAAERGVSVDFRRGNAATWDWGERPYDAVVAIFIQFVGADGRADIFSGMHTALAPGGVLLLHGYAPRQVKYGTGGPPHVENMYTLDMLRAAFAGYEVLRAEDYDADIREGDGHSGRSGLIDFVARKGGSSHGVGSS